MKTLLAVTAFCIGVGLTVWMVWLVGYQSLLRSIALAGFSGLALLCLVSAVPAVLLGTAWQVLVPASHRISLRDFVLARMVKDAISDISPLTAAGGIAVGIRVMILRRQLPAYAIASTAVDSATEAFAQAAFIILGLVLCGARFGSVPGLAAFRDATMAVIVALAVAGLATIFLRRGGGAAIRDFAQRLLERFKLDSTSVWALYEMFASPYRLMLSTALHFAAWLGSGLLTYAAFGVVGADISLLDALAVEAILSLLRSAAVMVPASLGVQEAGYAMLAPFFGVPQEMGLAVSLLRRARDVIAGLPALMWRQSLEGRRLRGASFYGS